MLEEVYDVLYSIAYFEFTSTRQLRKFQRVVYPNYQKRIRTIKLKLPYSNYLTIFSVPLFPEASLRPATSTFRHLRQVEIGFLPLKTLRSRGPNLIHISLQGRPSSNNISRGYYTKVVQQVLEVIQQYISYLREGQLDITGYIKP